MSILLIKEILSQINMHFHEPLVSIWTVLATCFIRPYFILFYFCFGRCLIEYMLYIIKKFGGDP